MHAEGRYDIERLKLKRQNGTYLHVIRLNHAHCVGLSKELAFG